MKKIYVAKPLVPDIEKLKREMEEVLETRYLTNMGNKHNLLEQKLQDVLKVPYFSLFNNGTIALLVAVKALDLPQGSEVITTPFTFAATPHCIAWNGLEPVFCDIEPDTMCIDADKIESMITPKTSAIFGVHVYGFPCAVDKIQKIADKHGLKIIYDAAHAFTTEIDGVGIGNFGDISMFSFHATKLYNTIEGGGLTYNDEELKSKIYRLRNFGIKDEDTITDIGINGKMNEIQAVFGLLNLELYKEEQSKRAALKKKYDEYLSTVKGIKLPLMPEDATNSYQYYPIVIKEDFDLSRDEIYDKLKGLNIFARKYFYPLCSDFECYKNLASSKSDNLPVANYLKDKVLCLPFYGDLEDESIEKICAVIY